MCFDIEELLVISIKSRSRPIETPDLQIFISRTVTDESIDMKIDNLDEVSIPTKIVATFDFEHPIHGTMNPDR